MLTKPIGAAERISSARGLWRRSREAAEPEGGEAVAWCKIGIICATSLCYAVLIPVFGFLVTTMGFIAGSTLILGYYSRGLPRFLCANGDCICDWLQLAGMKGLRCCSTFRYLRDVPLACRVRCLFP